MNEEIKQGRYHYFDLAKGLLILGLLVSHFSIMLKWAGVPDSDYFLPMYLIQPLYTMFFMQCFMLISGYCSKFNEDWKSFLIKLIKQIMVPYLFFSVLLMINFGIKGGFSNLMHSLIYYRFDYFWFMNALLLSKIVVYLLYRVVQRDLWILVIAFIIMSLGILLNQFSVGSNVCYYKHGLVAVFFVAFGRFCKRNSIIYEKLMTISLFVYPFFLFYYHFVGMLPGQDATINVDINEVPIFVLLTLSGSLAFLKCCKFIGQCDAIEYFGRNSIVIYCFHTIPFVYILKFVYFNLHITANNIIETVLFIVLVYGLLIVSHVLFIQVLNLKCFRFLIGR